MSAAPAVPDSPIWPAQLDHLRLDSDDPESLAGFYAETFGLARSPLADGTELLQAPGRRLVIGRGRPGDRPYHGFRVGDASQLREIRRFLAIQEVATEPSPSSLFEPDAVAVRDPDGWLEVFGLGRDDLPSPAPSARPPLPGRLQHVVVASNRLPAMADFYESRLGFVPSDYCDADTADPGTRRAAFYRTDPEHHSFAIFHASEVRADHHSYETTCWNDIRDWADHVASLGSRIWWGPGRHGPGNNLFFMIRDPHGHQVELSAEIEHMERHVAPRIWPLDERSLNLWGPGWIRE